MKRPLLIGIFNIYNEAGMYFHDEARTLYAAICPANHVFQTHIETLNQINRKHRKASIFTVHPYLH